ncbi:MAG: hypothetical protein M0R51_13180 [Clostridia bacterium]|jgi:transcription initiation factor TFIIIB Brf1 subunit/transcription initiation factor TFIIB|nr:hypothetical protein [Clostridia bacterium]
MSEDTTYLKTDTNMTNKLKPCPLCGGEAKRISNNRIACKKCGLRTVSRQSYIENEVRWNTRVKLNDGDESCPRHNHIQHKIKED